MTELPTTFGKYFLAEKLATGGMAEIYLGKLVGPGGFEKSLVIKQIHPRLSGQRQFVDLFVAEAKTLVSLAHGNIVPVYELGVIDDTYFIAMEYIDGPTLYRFTEALARRGARMEPAVAAWITARILEGLDYAHHKGDGVIHRDLSPRNVMLSRDGEVKLVDFGIAVPLGAAGEGEDGGDTARSAPTGSFPYMSPEQVRREPLTAQSDLFSAGVLMWEMLVGRRLFARADPDATLRAVTDAEIPRPSSVDPAIPARLDDVVMRALARDPAERWRSAREMLQELQRYLYSLDETPGPRDLAALVARYCPPETRRLPTHADAPTGDAPTGDATAGDAATADDAATALPGPRTVPIERDAAPSAGKRRARTETFATHVALKDLLERATPLTPLRAITDDDQPATAPATQPAPPRDEPAGAADADAADAPSVAELAPDQIALPVPGRTPPGRGLLVLLALGTLALGAAAVFAFVRGRGRFIDRDGSLAPAGLADAGLAADAPAASADAPVTVADAPAHASLDAAVPAGPGPGPHATHPTSAPAAVADAAVPALDAPRPAGDATLVIGANPWGDIYIDGARKGRTPTTLVVPAGKHAIDVVFGGEDPPRTRRFSVELRAGETQQLDADFTKP
jgi:tRNA A-37 threonylcarbamoyl transferase component Bud32